MTHFGRSRTFRPAFLIFAVLAVSGTGIERIEAGCTFPLFEQHILGGWFENCPDAMHVNASAFQLSNPLTVNSGVNAIVCRDAPSETTQRIPCQPEAGTLSDGRITTLFDWGGLYTGSYDNCPSPFERTGGEASRTMVHVVLSSGRSIILSLTLQPDMQTYVVETAQPYDGTASLPLSCQDVNREVLHIDQVSEAAGSIDVDLTMSAPPIASDCDPGTGGEVIGACPQGPSVIPATTLGRLYTKVLPCNGVADLRTTGWTFRAEPDAQGLASISFTAPVPGQCVYVGGTYRMNGVEVPVIAGTLQFPDVCGANGCNPNDGGIHITMSDSAQIAWQEPQAFSSYNMYRGDLAILRQTGAYTQDPAANPLAARVCGVSGTSLLDGVTPAPGQAIFFHVSGNDPGGELGLGIDSTGQQRPNTNPCQ